ncbi:MAG TPA: DUF1801 domain-containing protein [Candidatus Limnocylindrales bacterium]|jgi:uncharacterized protein YdhG (YjbR/CyaY superfamily)|nr:DUF1801 domain-containing protein [Candidatus Limnocylindrales bacterium]
MKEPTKTAKRAVARDETPDGWTDEEKAAMQERARELKSAGRRGKAATVDGESDLLAKIAEMPDADRAMAERIHAIVKEHAPTLTSRTWYGMPAYAKDGKVVFFFQSAAKFSARYATLGFQDSASLDEGTMWPTSFALTTLTPADEARIAELVRRAVA